MPLSPAGVAPELMRLVCPPEWNNPSPGGRYDLVVLGGGPAGLVCAAGAAGLGARVALIEKERLGGDCLHSGCVPSKTLIRLSRAHAAAHPGHAPAPAAFAAALQTVRATRLQLAGNDAAARFRDELKVDLYFGAPQFLNPRQVAVGGATLDFSRAVICTGARAAIPALPGLAEVPLLTNENLFEIEALPERLIILGAGPVGCEMAQAFARFGCRVTLLDQAPRILLREPVDAAALVAAALVALGVRIVCGTQVLALRRAAGETRLTLRLAKGTEEIAADAVLVGAGRVPNLEGLDLVAANVVSTAAGVTVDDRLRTSNRRIFAAGDVCSPLKFTHAADAMARTVLANALFGLRRRFSRQIIPRCTYTDPEVAGVGIGDEEAAARGAAIQTLALDFSANDRAMIDAAPSGFVRLHLQAGSDRICGATVVGQGAGELIGIIAAAMTSKTGLIALGATNFPYPSRSAVLRQIADLYNRQRLTPGRRRVLAGLQRLRR